MSEGDTTRVTTAAVKTLFESLPPGEPYTSTEVAAELDCARTTAYKKLQRLVDTGDLATKKVGARGRVWWLPLEIRDGETATTSTRAVPDYATLLAKELQYYAVFEEAFDAIVIADDDARYVDANPAACALFGLPREELLGKTILDFTQDGYDLEQAWGDFQATDLDRGLFPLVRPDGEERLVEFAATPNVLPGRHLSVLRDVTEKAQTEEELQRERERSDRYQRSLVADSVIELQFVIDGGDPFGTLSERLGCEVQFEGVVPTRDERLLHYVTVVGAALTDMGEVVHDLPQVDSCRLIHESKDGSLYELDMHQSPVKTLLEAGANGRSLSSESGVTTVLAEVGTDVRLDPIVSAFTEAYPTASFVAKRTLSRPLVTTRQYRAALAESFTERQTETLKAAYLSGYFEWPRASDAETVATSMGIASSTWLRHLRRAESKLVTWFFEELEA